VSETLQSASPGSLWSPALRDLTRGCDLVVCNLECSISERGRPTTVIPGKRFFFRAAREAVEALRALSVGAVSLANNHALDYGEEALADTLRLLDHAGIACAGAGFGPDAARSGTVVMAAGARVGLVGLTDHPPEYGARPGSWGVAYADLSQASPGWVADAAERLQGETDALVAFPHCGPNITVEPADWQRQRAEELLAAGAGLVAGHSAHVFHGVERHPGGLAAYDLGGAVDDYAVDDVLRNDLGVLALWSPGGEPELELVGLRLRYAHTELAKGADAAWIAARLQRACGELGTPIRPLSPGRHAVR
jgi:poly-gamma-glutamate synthesis protein (capsule biosynthesis protein)